MPVGPEQQIHRAVVQYRQCRARRKAGLACFQIEADEAGLCDATSRAMKRATGEPDPMD